MHIPSRATTERAVETHYGDVGPASRLYQGLRAAGLELEGLDVDSLAPVDEFHIRGRESTVELVELAGLDAGDSVLDVGCGIGGSARFLAEHHGCQVTGIDLTAAYCVLAAELSARVGLDHLVSFRQASALDLPFDDGAFDVAWTEHAQMNIADKDSFYREMARVVRPGGRVVFHDIFAGDGAAPVEYPMPWATSASESFLAAADGLADRLGDIGLEIVEWRDCTAESLAWFRGVRERIAADGPPAVGVHLLMGDDAAQKIANAVAGLESGGLATIQAVLRKPRA